MTDRDLHPSELDAIRDRAGQHNLAGDYPAQTADIKALLAYVDRMKAREDATWEAGYSSAESYREVEMEDAWEDGYRSGMAYEGANPDVNDRPENPYRNEERDRERDPRQQAIIDFLNRQSTEYRRHSSSGLVEDYVLALKEFGLKPDDLYDSAEGRAFIVAEVLRAEADGIERGGGTHGLRKLADDYAPKVGSDA